MYDGLILKSRDILNLTGNIIKVNKEEVSIRWTIDIYPEDQWIVIWTIQQLNEVIKDRDNTFYIANGLERAIKNV